MTNQLENLHHHSNMFVNEIEAVLKKLVFGDIVPSKIVRLRPIKKALIDTVAAFAEATWSAYTVKNTRKGFILNGQLDQKSISVPLLEYLLHTYWGNIEGTCLENKEDLVRLYIEEVHANGCIHENSFNNNNNIPKYKNSNGIVVERTNDPTQENRQQVKVLSFKMQIRQHHCLLDKKRMSEYCIKENWFNIEERQCKYNLQCERKFAYFVFISQADKPYTI